MITPMADMGNTTFTVKCFVLDSERHTCLKAYEACDWLGSDLLNALNDSWMVELDVKLVIYVAELHNPSRVSLDSIDDFCFSGFWL